MLRVLVGLLLAANLLFFGWTMGWMDGLLGRGSAPEREPERLAKQVNAQRVVLWPAAASASAAASGTPGEAATGAAAASAPSSSPVAPPVVMAAATPAAASTMAQASAARAPTPAGSAAALATGPASAATGPVSLVCLEAGPFNPAELAAATTALRATLPQGSSWVQRAGGTVAGGGEWMIYMGPYPDRDWMERKKRELARIRGGVPQEEIMAPPELARGISLGRFPTKAAADAALAQYALRGIRTARVVNSGPGATPLSYLRVAQANTALAASLVDLKLPPRGARFTACPR